MNPSHTPQRAVWRAGFAHCGDGTRAPEGSATCVCVERPESGAPPDRPPVLGRATDAHYPLAAGAGDAGVGTRHQPHSARPCELSLRSLGAARGLPGGGGCLLPVCGASGVGHSPTPDRPSLGPVAWAQYPLAVNAGSAGEGTRHDPHSVRSGELALPTVRAAQGRPGGGPLACVWGVRGWALSHARKSVLRACGRGPLPTRCGCGGCWLGDLSRTPQRALLRAGFARCGGGTLAPGGGAPCLCVGPAGLGALPRPNARPWGVRAGPATHWLWGRCVCVGDRLSLAPSDVPRFVVCFVRFPGLRHLVAVVAWHLSSCRGCCRGLASPACLVAPRWCAATRPIRLISVLRSAFPSPWCLLPAWGLSPPALLGGCAGHVEAGRDRVSLCLPLAPAEAWALGALSRPTRSGPRDGVIPGGSLRLRSWAASKKKCFSIALGHTLVVLEMH